MPVTGATPKPPGVGACEYALTRAKQAAAAKGMGRPGHGAARELQGCKQDVQLPLDERQGASRARERPRHALLLHCTTLMAARLRGLPRA
ncbi:hypothetical protein [Mumia zhuanghuii]|uniref:Uncharacterized protein n=1 Tax=Mumia zhuanghuii TaxID=2585211 RepID=A0A5C4LY59_9ACTN|nr:hypothetical protein [Mumia zhuanghuii]TNC22041.1 hypothetical protein FHE65_36210 [Mumia zhuanghuii]TNC22182.1 hypothetical protein FHE65_35885 [Mumia zhuanghuii]